MLASSKKNCLFITPLVLFKLAYFIMRQFFTLFLSTLFFTIIAYTANAQQLWSSFYPTPDFDISGSIIPVRAGGYLLTGTNSSGLLLARAASSGGAIWVRQHRIRNLSVSSPDLLCEDQAGRVLVAFKVGPSQLPYLALVDLMAGDTLWTMPGTGSYTDIILGPDQNFTLAASVGGVPYLLHLNIAGQVVQQTAVPFNSTVNGAPTRLTRGDGGYWLVVKSPPQTGNVTDLRFIFVSDTGVREVDVAGPRIGNNEGVVSFLPVENGNFLLATSSSVYKYSPNLTQLWTSSVPSPLNFLKALRNTNGQYVLLGSVYRTHNFQISITTYSNQGVNLGKVDYFTALYSTGFCVDAVTGSYILASSQPNPANNVDLFCAAYGGATVTVNTLRSKALIGNVYPNPITASELLVLEPKGVLSNISLRDLHGRIIRSWPTQPGFVARYTLSLQGVAAGLYYLQGQDQQQGQVTVKVVKQ